MSSRLDIWFLTPDLTISVTKDIAWLLSMMRSRDFPQFQAQEDGEFAEKMPSVIPLAIVNEIVIWINLRRLEGNSFR